MPEETKETKEAKPAAEKPSNTEKPKRVWKPKPKDEKAKAKTKAVKPAKPKAVKPAKKAVLPGLQGKIADFLDKELLFLNQLHAAGTATDHPEVQSALEHLSKTLDYIKGVGEFASISKLKSAYLANLENEISRLKNLQAKVK